MAAEEELLEHECRQCGARSTWRAKETPVGFDFQVVETPTGTSFVCEHWRDAHDELYELAGARAAERPSDE